MQNLLRRPKPLVLSTLVVLLLWAGFDLFAPRSVSIHQFSPEEVARLDAAMCRSYFEKKPMRLFRQLADLLRREYRLPYLRSH